MTQEGQALPCPTQTENLVEPNAATDLMLEAPHEGAEERPEAPDITEDRKEEEDVGGETKEADGEDVGAEGEHPQTKGEAGETTEEEEGGEDTHPPTEEETSDPRQPER